jgi:hypothetical protein
MITSREEENMAKDKNKSDKVDEPAADPLYPDGPPIADVQRAHSAEHYEGKSAGEIQAALDERENPEMQTQVPGASSAKASVEGASISKK